MVEFERKKAIGDGFYHVERVGSPYLAARGTPESVLFHYSGRGCTNSPEKQMHPRPLRPKQTRACSPGSAYSVNGHSVTRQAFIGALHASAQSLLPYLLGAVPRRLQRRGHLQPGGQPLLRRYHALYTSQYHYQFIDVLHACFSTVPRFIQALVYLLQYAVPPLANNRAVHTWS